MQITVAAPDPAQLCPAAHQISGLSMCFAQGRQNALDSALTQRVGHLGEHSVQLLDNLGNQSGAIFGQARCLVVIIGDRTAQCISQSQINLAPVRHHR